MFWEGQEALEQREAADRFLGEPIENDDEIPTAAADSDGKEQLGFDDATDGFHLDGQGEDYERGWQRGNAVRRLRP